MNNLWNIISKKNKTKWKSEYIFILINTLVFTIIGFSLWFIIHFFILKNFIWCICFSGYAGYFLGFLGGILYLWKK